MAQLLPLLPQSCIGGGLNPTPNLYMWSLHVLSMSGEIHTTVDGPGVIWPDMYNLVYD